MTENHMKSLDPTPVIEAALVELEGNEAALQELTNRSRSRLITDGIIGDVHNNDFVAATKRTIETVVRDGAADLSSLGVTIVTQAIYEISQIEQQQIKPNEEDIRKLMGDDTVFPSTDARTSTRASAA